MLFIRLHGEVRDWAELLCFLNREFQNDPGYELSIDYNDTSVTLERENGYTLTFDFADDRPVFEDYDAIVHNSDDTTLIDLVSENGRDESGAEQLIQRDTKASFDRCGDSLTVELGLNGIHMLMADGKYYIPWDFFDCASPPRILLHGRMRLSEKPGKSGFSDGTICPWRP